MSIQGYVEDASGQPSSNCKLFMYRRSDGTLLGSAVSNDSGNYELTHQGENGELVFIVCIDNDDSTIFEGLVRDRILINNAANNDSNEATTSAAITGFNIFGGEFTWTKIPTVDVYVNDILIATNIRADAAINWEWSSNQDLINNASQLEYSVYGDSVGSNNFFNQSSSYITFKFVPNSDGTLGNGEIHLAKDALVISNSNSNPTAYKDTQTGVITFRLAPNVIVNT